MYGYNELVELIDRTNATNGLDTNIEAVCNYQDMIGHSSREQLAELANDENRRRSFYWIYSTAYRFDDVINFYIRNDRKLCDLRDARDQLTEQNCKLAEDLRAARLQVLEAEKATTAEHNDRIKAENEAAAPCIS